MLKGKRVILAPPKREYIDTFLKWINDPDITQYLLSFKPITKEMEEEWFESLKDKENNFLFSILILQNDGTEKLIGNCGIHEIDWKNRVGECGIMIGEKSEHGKGYGTEAMELLVNYGFNTLNLNRLQLSVYDFNISAIKSYKKVGFIEEGRKRKAHFVNGDYHDLIIMGLLNEEWKGNRSKK
ncbi:MAG: GNAT family N-acetyltransferase [Candidatus Hodarchaeota archaeon]